MGKNSAPRPKKRAPAPYAIPVAPNPDINLVLAKIGNDLPTLQAFLRLADAQNAPTAPDNDNDIDEPDDDDEIEDDEPPVSPLHAFDSNPEVIGLKNQISSTLAQLRDAEIDFENIESNIQDGIIPDDIIDAANAELEKSRSRKSFFLALHANQQTSLNNLIASLSAAQAASASTSSPLAVASSKKGKQTARKSLKQEEDNPKPLTRDQELFIARLRLSAGLSIGGHTSPKNPAPPSPNPPASRAATLPPPSASRQPSLPPPPPALQPWNVLAGFANAPSSESISSPSSSTRSIRLPRKRLATNPTPRPSPSPSIDLADTVSSPTKKPKTRNTRNSLRAAAGAVILTQPPTDEAQSSLATPSTMTAGDSFESENQPA